MLTDLKGFDASKFNKESIHFPHLYIDYVTSSNDFDKIKKVLDKATSKIDQSAVQSVFSNIDVYLDPNSVFNSTIFPEDKPIQNSYFLNVVMMGHFRVFEIGDNLSTGGNTTSLLTDDNFESFSGMVTIPIDANINKTIQIDGDSYGGGWIERAGMNTMITSDWKDKSQCFVFVYAVDYDGSFERAVGFVEQMFRERDNDFWPINRENPLFIMIAGQLSIKGDDEANEKLLKEGDEYVDNFYTKIAHDLEIESKHTEQWYNLKHNAKCEHCQVTYKSHTSVHNMFQRLVKMKIRHEYGS